MKCGLPSRSFDVARGPHEDLTQPSVLLTLRREILGNKVLGAFLSPPCRTWGPSGNRTVQVRSSMEPWGLKTLVPGSAAHARVVEGNRVMRAVFATIRLLHKQGVPWILEHPHGSFLFKTEAVENWMKSRTIGSAVLDQCQFGVAWRKRTRLLCGNLDMRTVAFVNRRCHAQRGYCSRTGRKHFHLEGVAPSGQKWTSLAAAYPKALGMHLAKALSDDFRGACADRLCSKLVPPSPPLDHHLGMDLGKRSLQSKPSKLAVTCEELSQEKDCHSV